MTGTAHEGPPRSLTEPRHAAALTGGVVALWLLGFALFYPDAFTLGDEAAFVRQAVAYANGSSEMIYAHPLTGGRTVQHPTERPPATALLLAPFVRAFGWQGSFVLPALALLAAVGLTALWIRAERRSPLFALAIPLFPAAAVLGRTPTSDVLGASWAAAGLFLFWRGGGVSSLGAGVLAGAAPLLRETLPLLFAPLFLGALLRRERRSAMLALGGALGVAIWLLANAWAHGDALHVRRGLGYDFSGANLVRNLPFYAFTVLVLAPGGLALSLAYRGPCRAELCATVIGFLLFHASYGYTGTESGRLGRLVLGTRFVIPLLPILAFQAAESAPRLWRAIGARLGERARALERMLPAAVLASLAALALALFAVHPLFWSFQRSHAQIARLLYQHTERGAPLLAPIAFLYKYLNGVYGERAVYDLEAVPIGRVPRILARHGTLYLVLLDRTDSEHWRRRTEVANEYVDRLRPLSPDLLVDHTAQNGERLRIWRLRHGRGFPRPSGEGA